MVEIHFLLKNLWISVPSLGILEKFQSNLALSNIKYNFPVLFWSQLFWLFIYASKSIYHIKKILIDTHTKIWTEITDTVVFRKKLLKFLQGAYFRNCITRNCDSRLHDSCWVNLLSTFPPWIHCISFTVRSGPLFACHMFCNYDYAHWIDLINDNLLLYNYDSAAGISHTNAYCIFSC